MDYIIPSIVASAVNATGSGIFGTILAEMFGKPMKPQAGMGLPAIWFFFLPVDAIVPFLAVLISNFLGNNEEAAWFVFQAAHGVLFATSTWVWTWAGR